MTPDLLDSEPWAPAGRLERLTVGARVRIRLSAEGPNYDAANMDDGKIGVITLITRHGWEGYPYVVDIEGSAYPRWTFLYGPLELIPLAPAPDSTEDDR